MLNPASRLPKETHAAFRANEVVQRVTNTKVGCLLVILLMPAGSSLDFFVYRDCLRPFFYIRIACSLIAAAILLFLFTNAGRKAGNALGVIVPMLPAVSIAGMIAFKEGFLSPYYAGLNLVLLAVGAVLNWTVRECIFAVIFVLAMYVGAGIFHGYQDPVHGFEDKNYPWGVVFNNFYFLILMDIIVVVGTYVQENQRLREFSLRFELDRNRKALEESNSDLEKFNIRLSDQNLALEQANRDIRAAEAQLVQSEKMASLGLLAAKIAHEIRNPLNYARMNLDTLRKRFKNLPPEQHDEAGAIVADMSDGFTRIDTIVSDLLTFSQPGGQEPEPVDVAHVFKSTLRYVANQLTEKNIRLEQNLTLGHLIWVNRQQFNQVLVNLLENSIDALGTKQFSRSEQPTITVSCRRENDRQLISIRDNGAGIDPQHLAKIFDPFFTTKDIGKGTGLGLSICFGIVRGYGGNLRVESEPGKFCEFTIDLPANDPAQPSHGNT
jgi:two-component system sensor histidine kinase PhcS